MGLEKVRCVFNQKRKFLLRYLYSLLFYCAMPFVFLRLFWRSRKLPAYRQGWFERLGLPTFRLQQCIWVHAVSLGETIAAIPLITGLQKHYPDMPILVTNMTPTGASRVKAVFGKSVYQAYVPYDLPDAIKRFLARVHPKILIVMETELWPNLFAICKKRKIPLMIANARLSKKSTGNYRRIQKIAHELLTAVDILAAQSKTDARNFALIGMSPKKINVTGNLKFDLVIPEDLFVKCTELRDKLGRDRLIWIAASTHPSEEEIILSAHKKICESFPTALLILVPRHPDRFNSVEELLKKEKFNYICRSQDVLVTEEVSVYLGDTLGELLLMYGASDVAFVGGSLVPIGGHNMLEPAALGLPLITGPELFNFSETSAILQQAKGLFIVKNTNELAKLVLKFFRDSELRAYTGKQAKEVVESNKGSLGKHLELVASLLVLTK